MDGQEGANLQGSSQPGRSAVLPYRGDPDEARMLPGFVQTVMQGGIDELVIGIDRSAHEYPEIADACDIYPGRVRAVVVPASPDWGFRFAAVVWHLIGEAKHDLVLVTNVDEMPSSGALGPPQKAGRDDCCPLESGPAESGESTPLPGWSGTFWVWKPALGRYFDPSLYKNIRDGGDTFFFWSAVEAGLRYHIRQAPWTKITREGHMRLDWFRWKAGLREGAVLQGELMGKVFYRRAARNFVAIRKILKEKDVAYLAGWLSAMLRPNSYWARQSRAMNIADWVYQGRLPYDDLCRQWWRRAPSSRAVMVHGRNKRVRDKNI